MKSDRPIVGKWKTNIYALLVIVLIQALSLLLLNSLFVVFNEQISVLATVRFIVLTLASFICIWIDLFFAHTRIILLGQLLQKTPTKCRIEDILYISYKENGRTRYSPYLIVRSIESGRLFFTYDGYSLLHFNTSSSYAGNRMVNCTIYKKGRIPVSIGDSVDMYLLKVLDIPVRIDIEKNIVKLKNKKIKFYHKNGGLSITVFNEITFFQGAIDLDVDSK